MGRTANWTDVTVRGYNWRGGLNDVDGGVASIIAERPFVISVIRQDPVTLIKTTLDDQTVRIDLDTRLMEKLGIGTGVSSSQTSKQRVIILGYKGQIFPPDTDLLFGDYFQYNGNQFVVRKVEVMFTDRLIAEAEAEG